MEEMIGLDFIKYYEAHKNLFKYKMSKEYLKEHYNFEDPMADNCVGSDSEYYIGWNAFMVEEVPVLILAKNYEWVQELLVYMTKEAMLLHNRYEWIKLLEDQGVFYKNLNFNPTKLCGLAKDVASDYIGKMNTFYENEEDSCGISFIVGFGFGVMFYDESPYILNELIDMDYLNKHSISIAKKHAQKRTKSQNLSDAEKSVEELEREIFKLIESLDSEENNKEEDTKINKKAKEAVRLTDEEISEIVQLLKNYNKNEQDNSTEKDK